MTPEQVGAWAAVGGVILTVVGSVLGYILHQKDANQEKEMERIDASLKAAFAQIDKLKDERQIYVRQEAMTAMRAELKEDIRQLGDRLIGEINRLLQARGGAT